LQVKLREVGRRGVTSALVLCRKEARDIVLDGVNPVAALYQESSQGRLGIEDSRVTMRLQMHVHMAQVVNCALLGRPPMAEDMHSRASGGGALTARTHSSGGEKFFDAPLHTGHSTRASMSSASENEVFFDARTPSEMPLRPHASRVI
jgi:hypothetical protein